MSVDIGADSPTCMIYTGPRRLATIDQVGQECGSEGDSAQLNVGGKTLTCQENLALAINNYMNIF